MNRQVKIEANEDDENALEIMNFDPTELLTNKPNEYNKIIIIVNLLMKIS